MNDPQETVDRPNVQALVGAACAALRQAYEHDLPWVDDVETVRDAEADPLQADWRDLYAAQRLCNITYGPLARLRRRPALRGLRSMIVPCEDSHRIVVLAQERSAAIYSEVDGAAVLLHVIERVAAVDDLMRMAARA